MQARVRWVRPRPDIRWPTRRLRGPGPQVSGSGPRRDHRRLPQPIRPRDDGADRRVEGGAAGLARAELLGDGPCPELVRQQFSHDGGDDPTLERSFGSWQLDRERRAIEPPNEPDPLT